MMRVATVLLVGLSTTAAMGDAAPGRVPVPVAVPVSGPPGAGAWITAVLAVAGLVLMYLPASNAYFSAARRHKAWRTAQGR